MQGFSVFAYPTTTRFVKGFGNLFPQIRAPTPIWGLNFVLNSLMKPPFEPLAKYWLLYLSVKTAFLVAIISAHGIGELCVLMGSPPFMVFLKDKIPLCQHPKFIFKISSNFQINQTIHLPVYFPKSHHPKGEAALHIWNIRRALTFYLDRTKPFRNSSRLLTSVADRSKGSWFSTQRLSKWVSSLSPDS